MGSKSICDPIVASLSRSHRDCFRRWGGHWTINLLELELELGCGWKKQLGAASDSGNQVHSALGTPRRSSQPSSNRSTARPFQPASLFVVECTPSPSSVAALDTSQSLTSRRFERAVARRHFALTWFGGETGLSRCNTFGIWTLACGYRPVATLANLRFNTVTKSENEAPARLPHNRRNIRQSHRKNTCSHAQLYSLEGRTTS